MAEDGTNAVDMSGIIAAYKMVDTCAAEFAAETPYYYSVYGNSVSALPVNCLVFNICGINPVGDVPPR